MMVKAGDREREAGTACLYLCMGRGVPIALRMSQPSSVDPSEPWTQA